MSKTWMLMTIFVVALRSSSVMAQVEPECDLDGDGVVDTFDPVTWDEDAQQANMLNFFAIMMNYTPLHSPAPLSAGKLLPNLELSYVPQLTCIERSVFHGTKSEPANKTFAYPRFRVTMGLPFNFYVGLSGIPPVPIFGVKTGVMGAEFGYGAIVNGKLELGARAYIMGGRIEGDLAGPFEGQVAVDDVYRNTVYGLEAGAGYRLETRKANLTPYVGAGYTRVIALMYVGESLPADYDETDPNQASVPTAGNDRIANMLYSGATFQVGLSAQRERILVTAEAQMVPLGFRFFFAPKISIGYTFF